ncbi:MAG TPA: hypothetical protein VF098_10360 [Sphingomicrobium sp.]
MLTRVFLAAGVAALAIAAPAYAGPHGGGGGGGHGNGGGGPHGGGGPPPQAAQGGGGHGGGGPHGGGGGPAFGGGGRGHGGGGPMIMGGGGGGRGHGGGFAAPRMQVQRQEFRGFQRQQSRGVARQQARGFERQQARGFAQQRAHGGGRQQTRAIAEQRHGNGHAFAQQQARQQARGFERQQARMAGGQQLRGNRAQQQQQAFANQQAQQRQLATANAFNGGRQAQFANVQGFGGGAARHGLIDGCPPGLWMKNNGCMPPGQAAKLVGSPLSTAATIAALSAIPASVGYLYPDTPDYYWRYGDGYAYQVDRTSNLIASLLPLFGGGYMPGQYLPAAYMDSYVPSYYGYDAFYPDYGDVCNRYYYGVIYQVDCASGYVDDVIPAYAGGYGVGQILPSAYSYYNVPYQYRPYYYDTADYGYWYAPGAIYQYDPRSSMITSVAALLSPGFSIGQPLPAGYGVYNVPYAYRETYYDTPTAWYRYSNGYIYQVDPTTQLVTAIVASLLNNA